MKKLVIATTLLAGLMTTSAFAGGEYQDAVSNAKWVASVNSSDSMTMSNMKDKSMNETKMANTGFKMKS